MRCADVAVEAGALGEGAAAGGAPVHLQVLVHSPVQQGGVVALVRADYSIRSIAERMAPSKREKR